MTHTESQQYAEIVPVSFPQNDFLVEGPLRCVNVLARAPLSKQPISHLAAKFPFLPECLKAYVVHKAREVLAGQIS